NYPNPFNPTTTIKYQIPEMSSVTLKVFDVLGNEIVTLVDEYKSAGEYKVDFSVGQSATSSSSPDIASGIYFYQLLVSALQNKDGKAGSFIQTKKMVLIK
ncbi:MAG: T9SS type A sorting domain-containing protein, partial [Ignavibacteriaceae bacterium]